MKNATIAIANPNVVNNTNRIGLGLLTNKSKSKIYPQIMKLTERIVMISIVVMTQEAQ
jgi:hypothetical protein